MKIIAITDKLSIHSFKTSIKEFPGALVSPNDVIIDEEFSGVSNESYFLIIEDEKNYLLQLAKFGLSSKLFDTIILINNPQSFFKILPKLLKKAPSIISLDFVLNSVRNIYAETSEIYKKIKQVFPSTPVIGYTNFEESEHPQFPTETKRLIELLTSNEDSVYDKSNIDSSSAYSNILRDKLRLTNYIKENKKLKKENAGLKKLIDGYPSISGKDYIIGSSPAMRKLYNELNLIKRGQVRVLILGERGVGKELIARAIYEDSPRGKNRNALPWERANCRALGEDNSRIISNLFGHVKGAYPDATKDKPGIIELANNGTLFLDEIGDLPIEVQTMLLRFLETKEYMRLGDSTTRKADVRIISATNANVQDLLESGKFRPDFYDRIGVYPITVPPLRERKEDIPLLVEFFINNKNLISEEFGPGNLEFSITDEAVEKIESFDFNGNVRELKNLLIRAMLHSLKENNQISVEHILKSRGVSNNIDSDYNTSLEDAIEFLDQIESILQMDIFSSQNKVSHDEVAKYFKSTKKGQIGISRNSFSQDELAPRKNTIEKLMDDSPERWPTIRIKNFRLTTKKRRR